MEETLEYWQEVLDQHQKHLEILDSKLELGSFDLDRKNAQIAINEAIKKIEELS